MKNLEKPELSVSTVYPVCISLVRSLALKNRLEACQDLIEEAEEEYDGELENGNAHNIEQEEFVNNDVTRGEMKDVYVRMRTPDNPGRVYYDQLRLSAPNNICPYCSHNIVSTLDHFLPESFYPRLVVTPFNLVPSCSDCNKTKFTTNPEDDDKVMFHPYYDLIDGDQWLIATVVEGDPPFIEFDVNPPNDWDENLTAKITNHFEELGLNGLYSTQAASEIADIKLKLRSLFNSGGADVVKSHFIEDFNSRSAENRNSWRAALYGGLNISDWYCNGGFDFK